MINKFGKIWIVVAVFLILVCGYFVFAKYQMLWPFTTKTPVVTPTTIPRVLQSSVDDFTSFDSKLLNLSFKYPVDGSYKEGSDIDSYGIKHTGEKINFSDSNKKYPSFEAISMDFSADFVVPLNLIYGNLDSINSFSVTLDRGYGIKKEIGSGMYFYAGYMNVECSHATDAYLFVKPPKNSGLKYISFYLGSNDKIDYSKDPIDPDPCSANPVLIKQGVQDLADNKILLVKENLDKAVVIADTFQ